METTEYMDPETLNEFIDCIDNSEDAQFRISNHKENLKKRLDNFFKPKPIEKYSDCALLDENNICTGLICTQCLHGDCTFYKSKNDFIRRVEHGHNGEINYSYDKIPHAHFIIKQNIVRTSSGLKYNEVSRVKYF